MQPIRLIICLFLLGSCHENKKSNPTFTADSTVNPQKEKNSSEELDSLSLSPRLFAEGIISGEIAPGDNEQTFAWLDSLTSDNKATREYAFSVYKAISIKADGALSEAICGYVKSYFHKYPKEFLDNYRKLSNDQRLNTQENIAYEFYASGTTYQEDIDEYFREIRNSCTNCNRSQREELAKIKMQVEEKVRQMLD